jgi:hypothetical protein
MSYSSQEVKEFGVSQSSFGSDSCLYAALNKGGPAETAQVHAEESGAQLVKTPENKHHIQAFSGFSVGFRFWHVQPETYRNIQKPYLHI